MIEYFLLGLLRHRASWESGEFLCRGYNPCLHDGTALKHQRNVTVKINILSKQSYSVKQFETNDKISKSSNGWK